jgi:transposase-like protein
MASVFLPSTVVSTTAQQRPGANLHLPKSVRHTSSDTRGVRVQYAGALFPKSVMRDRLTHPPSHMPLLPRIARAPLTAKTPETCPHCGSHSLTRRGMRKKKLEIVQLWRCGSCKRVFTPGPAALRNKTYPLRMILAALTDYDTGYMLEETAARLKKKTNRRVSPSTITTWLQEYKQHCSYRRLRRQGLARFPRAASP